MSSHATQQITTTLRALLPTYTSPTGDDDDLPRPLVQLTQSLLQRSRSRAPNLRNGEEEAARVWCVAEMACERLKGRLNLPRIESRPPCPPKVYRRLYGFLEGALAEGDVTRNEIGNGNGKVNGQQRGGDGKGRTTGASGSRGKGRKAGAAAGDAMPLRTATPQKRGAPPVMEPQRASAGAKRAKIALSTPLASEDALVDVNGEADDNVAPAVRHLCQSLDVPSAVAHVYVGVRTVLKSNSPASLSMSRKRAGQKQNLSPLAKSSTISKDRIPALIILVFLAVFERLGTSRSSSSRTREELIGEAAQQLTEAGFLGPKQTKSLDQDMDYLEDVAQEDGWWAGEWLENVPSGDIGIDDDEGDGPEDADPMKGTDEFGKPLAQATATGVVGRGCLMQDRFDWLTDERKRDYERWKADILSRLEAKEDAQRVEQRQDPDDRGSTGGVFSSIRQSLFGR